MIINPLKQQAFSKFKVNLILIGLLVCGLLIISLTTTQVKAYPIDGGEKTKIQRLIDYPESKAKLISRGARWPMEKIQLKLVNQSVAIPSSDPQLEKDLLALLGEDKDNYGIALLDLSDLNSPIYAAYNGDKKFNPGSVGKLFVGLAFFQAMADHFGSDVELRDNLLKNTWITADELIESDHHDVPVIDPTSNQLVSRRLKIGDTGNLWTYFDWMFSASSNAAASMVIKELIFLNDFKKDYTTMRLEGDNYLKLQPKKLLSQTLTQALQEPISRNGLDPLKLQQGGFFTHTGKKKIPGSNSYATPAALIDYLVKLEQGKLVDEYSSLALKQLLYITQKRIRYASSPALASQAVFFKSGSLYRCKPETGFSCKKYMGNVENLLNSVAIIESATDAEVPVYYMVALTSNVLYKNSAVEHQTLAGKIHQLIIDRHRPHNPLKIDQKK